MFRDRCLITNFTEIVNRLQYCEIHHKESNFPFEIDVLYVNERTEFPKNTLVAGLCLRFSNSLTVAGSDNISQSYLNEI